MRRCVGMADEGDSKSASWFFLSVREIHECALNFEGLSKQDFLHPSWTSLQSSETGTNVSKLNISRCGGMADANDSKSASWFFLSVREIHECALNFEGLSKQDFLHPSWTSLQSSETGTNVSKLNISRCGGMADANDSKSFGKPCGFESHHRHSITKQLRIERF